jgi:AcrR family transcriptional regulator
MSTTARRIGTETSKTRAVLLDAAERLMLEEGYAAVTSRRIAARAGLKPQLVHYYFRTMDDLFLALFRRRADQGLERQARALEGPQPLWSLWDLSRDPRGTALTMEFTALANHRKAIQAELCASAERYRAGLLEAFRSVLTRYEVDQTQFPPMVCAVLLTSISTFLVIEQAMLGMSTGHAETVAFVEDLVRRLEGERIPAGGHSIGAPDQTRKAALMRVVVDFDQCESNALCMGILPEVFEVRDDDFLYVLDEHPREELREKLMEAVRSCPKNAISIED